MLDYRLTVEAWQQGNAVHRLSDAQRAVWLDSHDPIVQWASIVTATDEAWQLAYALGPYGPCPSDDLRRFLAEEQAARYAGEGTQLTEWDATESILAWAVAHNQPKAATITFKDETELETFINDLVRIGFEGIARLNRKTGLIEVWAYNGVLRVEVDPETKGVV